MGGVTGDNAEYVEGPGGSGYVGGIACDGSHSIGGHGGINSHCAGWGVQPNVRKYSSSHQVRLSTVDAIRCTPASEHGFGEWTMAAAVAEGWTEGYGALHNTGPSSRDGVWRAV